ncbi:cytochrome c oxidase subunit 2 [Amylibacter marinus]|uniref:Cytochrome c oxidase subunit 2 n=1 Tax=Amylibacter marinus TaxID=1475483 RepID=A0ABQ5VU40_9RHOB|nr:cytochrome c oxidase subunit II [Amylibacter marinus]GLQ34921.1 cytochrome c oxidase subunit 2 [Amylibacter marinus]
MAIAKVLKTSAAALVGFTLAGSAFAQQSLETIGKPIDKGIDFQTPVTEVARDIQWLDNFLLWIIGIICLFVTVLLVYCAVRFSAKRNPVPATFSHNSTLEKAWTMIPVLILLAIMPPSLNLLFKQLEIPEADITIKAIGNQWYWTHEYVDHEFGFDSFMLERDQLAENGYADDEYLLATDTAVVVPVGKTVVVQVTASDVIHSWTIPAFGVKQDAVPGRLAELWFNAEKEGVYFGQCSELCGKDHSYMPITVKVVSQEAYDAWLDGAIKEYAGIPRSVEYAEANMAKVLAAETATN